MFVRYATFAQILRRQMVEGLALALQVCLCLDVHTRTHGFIMPASTTMTIRISPDVKDKLGRLAQGTRRSRAFLASEAVEAYVDRELEIIDGIQRGLADVAASRMVPHDEAMAELQAVIDATRGGRA
jgi:predicted transcriptional regulator